MSKIKTFFAIYIHIFVAICGFSQERMILSNGIEIWTETFGNSNHSPLLLIMGGGCQGIMWPQEFCKKLAENEFFVIRYDNRDMGFSSAIDYDRNPYDLMDMAKDAIGILDYFGIEQAHIVGTSMGGLIAQLMAAYFPERVKMITLISTSSDFSSLVDVFEETESNSALSKPKDSYLSWIRSIIKNPAQTNKKKIAQHLEGWRILNGRSVKFDEDLYQNLILQQMNRMNHPAGLNNHFSALKASLKQNKIALNLIKSPTLIIHGSEDPIFPLDHGQALQQTLGGSKLVIIDGMGHNLNTYFYDAIISNIKLEESTLKEKISDKTKELEDCFINCYHTDLPTAKLIQSKLNFFICDITKHSILDDFIEKSKNLKIDFSIDSSIIDLPPDDAIVKAPQWHEILFESPYFRILWGVTKPNDPEPFHRHYWKSLMLIIQGSHFEIENEDGSKEIGNWPIGIYELPIDIQSAAYVNIGITDFKALRFEIKGKPLVESKETIFSCSALSY